jgi:hypothetical protein
MPVPTQITDLSTTAASNSPAGAESARGTIDDYLRAHASFIAQTRADAVRPDKSFVSAPNATATTLFTIPNVPNSTWLVSVQLYGADTASYAAFAVISTQTTSIRFMSNVAGTLLTISNSGLNIQATQGSGSTTNIYYSAARIM